VNIFELIIIQRPKLYKLQIKLLNEVQAWQKQRPVRRFIFITKRFRANYHIKKSKSYDITKKTLIKTLKRKNLCSFNNSEE
jgi:hypothetical protein